MCFGESPLLESRVGLQSTPVLSREAGMTCLAPAHVARVQASVLPALGSQEHWPCGRGYNFAITAARTAARTALNSLLEDSLPSVSRDHLVADE